MKSDASSSQFNIGTGNSISILELAKLMISISDLDLEPIMLEALKGDIEKSQSDSSSAEKTFGWKAQKKLEDWLKETMK